MRVLCKCGERATISHSHSNDNESELACSCKDPKCGHSFISAIAYKHSRKASKIHLGMGAASKPSLSGSRIFCGCGERSIITKTNRLSNDCADLYCECKSQECGHQFVMSLYFSYTLSPSSKATNDLATCLSKVLPPNKRLELSQQLSLI